MIFLLIVAYILISLLEIPHLVRQKYWRDLTYFIIFMAAAFIVPLLQVLGFKVPSPLLGIQHLLEGLGISYKP